MKLEQVNVGTIYRCKLSGKKMLIIETQKSVQTPTGENDEHGNPAYDTTTTDAKAGKYCEELDNGSISFKHDEIIEGQLEEITND